MDFDHILDNLFLQLNQCRLHPRETAQQISTLRNSYQGNLFKNQYKTREGTKALDNLIQDLSQRAPVQKKLKWSFALHMVADSMASELGVRGIFTTQGTNRHATLPERVKDFAIIKGRLSEVYQFGGTTAQSILEQLLIDDGLASRKRRNTLLDPIYQYVGIGSSYHQKNQACTVIVLAQDIVSLVAPHTNGQYKKRDVQIGRQRAVQLLQDVTLNIPGHMAVNNLANNIVSQTVPTVPVNPPPRQSVVPQQQPQPQPVVNPIQNQQNVSDSFFILPDANRNTTSLPNFNVIPPPPHNPEPSNFLNEMNNIRSSNVSNISNASQNVNNINNVNNVNQNTGQTVTYNNNSPNNLNANVPNVPGQSVTYTNNTNNVNNVSIPQSNHPPTQPSSGFVLQPINPPANQLPTLPSNTQQLNPNVRIVDTVVTPPIAEKKQSSRCSIM